ncbi:Gfo/Idh/MocA family oxidoreductase [Vibrio tubiashii]|uniref:Gfo/Idh/MocA family oxidoreductase n=1 Tax=Vibrio tubiashii TaxID=29498 RepID=UPI001EFE24F5|nr:Gfo/Idh/MocA family oxidoreductase [Vibrio tubiashii]MCG9579477.1 Gfo/Idh/MocA family oxidoreductase [Vibrio tubiashii]
MALKVGIVGCGRMGALRSNRLQGVLPPGWLPVSHMESVIESPQANVIGVADVSQSSLNYVKNEYGVEKIYTDYSDLLKNDIDILTCATRTPTKADILIQAIEAGVKGIYVEKPLCNSLKECNRILFSAQKNNVLLSYGVNRRFHATYLKAKEIAQSRELGELVEVRADFGFSPLMWTHPHTFDLLNFYGGQPTALKAILQIEGDVVDYEEKVVDADPKIVSVEIEYENGVLGKISKCGGNIVTLMFEYGVIIVHGDGANLQIMRRPSKSSEYFTDQTFVNPMGERGATVTAIDDLVNALTENKCLNYISDVDIHNNMLLILGCVWSQLNDSSKIELKDIPEELVLTGRSGEYFA